MRLQAQTHWFQPTAGSLLPQLHAEFETVCRRLGGPGSRPLRWAITSADPDRGLCIELVLVLEEPGEDPQGC